MNPNHLPPDEEAAALAVKWVKLLIQQTELDSDTDHWRALKDKVAQLEPIADAILGHRTWMILDGFDGFNVKPKRFLGEAWSEVNEVVRALGGKWQKGQTPRDGSWRIPK